MMRQNMQTMRRDPVLSDILNHQLFLSMDSYRHHANVSCLDHTLLVADLVYTTARRWGLDHHSATRGALLHDFYLYDWHTGGPGFHGLKHARIALRNAESVFSLNDIEKNAILRHMWPLTPIPPRYPESLLVSLADKVSSYREYQQAARMMLSPKRFRFRPLPRM